jgi:hypothetical protein
MTMEQQPQSHLDEVTRLIQEGRRPEDLRGRAQLAADKLSGKVPLGVDASNKTTRKAIGGAGSLFKVIKYGLIGLLLVLCGTLFVWAGSNSGIDVKVIGTGIAVLAIGIFALTRAWRAWQILKAISRA